MTEIATSGTDLDEVEDGRPLLGGRYTVVCRIGRGGVATVYRARTTKGTDVALKIMRLEKSEDPSQRIRFQTEKRLGMQLSDLPVLPRVLDAGVIPELDDRPFLALELLAAYELDYMLAHRALPQRRAAVIGRAIADALAKLHARGVVHRDIKPGNVMVKEHGGAAQIWLLDLGYAHSRGDEQAGVTASPDVTGLLHRPGTKHYMAPEQALGQPAAPSFDLYALAMTLHEMLTHELPYGTLPPHEAVRRRLVAGSGDLSISGKMPGLDPGLENLIDDGLRRDPHQRIASAAEFRDRLDAVVACLPTDDAVDAATEQGRTTDGAAVVARPAIRGATEPAEAASSVHAALPALPPRLVPEPAANQSRRGPIPASWKRAALSSSRATDNLGIPTTATASLPTPASIPVIAEASPRRSAIWAWGSAAAVLVVLAAIGAWAASLDDDAPPSTRAEHPLSEPAPIDPALTPAPEPSAVTKPDVEPDQPIDIGSDADPPESKAPDLLGVVEPEPEPDSQPEPRPEPRKRPRRDRVRPSVEDPPRTMVPEPDGEHCRTHRKTAKSAFSSRAFGKVIDLTDNATCWPSASERLRLRQSAFVGRKNYRACVRLANKTSDPIVRRVATVCEKKLEEAP